MSEDKHQCPFCDGMKRNSFGDRCPCCNGFGVVSQQQLERHKAFMAVWKNSKGKETKPLTDEEIEQIIW